MTSNTFFFSNSLKYDVHFCKPTSYPLTSTLRKPHTWQNYKTASSNGHNMNFCWQTPDLPPPINCVRFLLTPPQCVGRHLWIAHKSFTWRMRTCAYSWIKTAVISIFIIALRFSRSLHSAIFLAKCFSFMKIRLIPENPRSSSNFVEMKVTEMGASLPSIFDACSLPNTSSIRALIVFLIWWKSTFYSMRGMAKMFFFFLKFLL